MHVSPFLTPGVREEEKTPTFGIFVIRQTDIVGKLSVRQTDIRRTDIVSKPTLGEPSLDELKFSQFTLYLFLNF